MATVKVLTVTQNGPEEAVYPHGTYKVLDSGVLRVTTGNLRPEYYSPSGWLWVADALPGDPAIPPRR